MAKSESAKRFLGFVRSEDYVEALAEYERGPRLVRELTDSELDESATAIINSGITLEGIASDFLTASLNAYSGEK